MVRRSTLEPRRTQRSNGHFHTAPDLSQQAGARTSIEPDTHAVLNLRRHAWRATLRISTLLIVDLSAFLLLRAALRGIRESAVLGTGAAAFIRWLFAQGYLGGWQFAVALVLSLAVTGNYGPGDRRRDPIRLLSACALATALPLWAELWNTALLLTFSRYVLTVIPACATLLLARLALDHLVARFAPHPHAGAVARTVLVGHAGECIGMRGRKALMEHNGFQVLGFVDIHSPATRGALGSLDDLGRILRQERVDTVILCGLGDDNAIVHVLRAATTAECQVLAVTRKLELAGMRPSIIWRRGQPFIALRTVGLRGHQLFLKRLVDVCISAAALALLSPVFLIIAAAIRLESRGPVIFSQERVGRHGRVFRFFKFRSMCADAEERLREDAALYQQYVENSYKLPCTVDTRVTRTGRFLRRTSLDELPQLWNVLKGDMSLVGPRPIVPEHVSYYYGNGEAPLLLSLKPGITGAWQVGGRSTIGYPERAMIELEYIERWNFLRDLSILMRTVPAVLSQRGAH